MRLITITYFNRLTALICTNPQQKQLEQRNIYIVAILILISLCFVLYDRLLHVVFQMFIHQRLSQ